MATRHSYDHANYVAAAQPGMLISVAALRCCQNWLSMIRAGRRMLSATCGMQQGVSFKGRRKLCRLLPAARDGPEPRRTHLEASSVSSHSSPTATTARLVAATKRLAHCEHRLKRDTAKSWLDCKLDCGGAHLAAPANQGQVFSRTACSLEVGV